MNRQLWTIENEELCLLLSKIDFNISVEDNLRKLNKVAKEAMFANHPDKNGDLKVEKFKRWNEANSMANNFLAVCGESERYSDFENGNVRNIIGYMFQKGFTLFNIMQERDKLAEYKAYDEQEKQRAINEIVSQQARQTIYDGLDAEHQQGILIYIYVCIWI
jgi:hypothetical protein